MLYASGSNGSGQLGIGSYDDANTWTRVNLAFDGRIDLSGGGNHTVIVECNSGRAYVTIDAQFKPISHPQQRKWLLSSSGWDFSYLVDEIYQVWKLSFPIELDLLEFEFPAPIKAIRSGMNHTIAMLSNGDLFGWGNSRKGQCGIAAAEVQIPHKLPLNKPSSLIACGRDYTVAASQSDDDEVSEITIWGSSNKFQNLQLGTQPYRVDRLLSGWSHIMINNTMYGSNFHNQVDVPIASPDCVSLGSEHGICTKKNTVYTWGWGEHGNCPPVAEFPGSQIQVFGGCATSFVYVQ